MPGVKGRSGRRPKPTAVLKATGGYRKDRHGNRLDTVAAVGKPQKPDGLSPIQSALWDDVVDNLPEGVLGSIDTIGLTCLVDWYGIYCTLMDRVEEDITDLQMQRSASKVWRCFHQIALDYGLTPSSRARLQIPPRQSDTESNFEAIIARMGGRPT